MKKSFIKKMVAALFVVIALVAVSATSVMATVAYLTSSAAVSNVFTIGNVGITMTESKVNPDGTLFDGGTTRVDTNTYHLVPNKTYIKDPTIYVNAGSENSYLFVAVRNDIEAIACQYGTLSVTGTNIGHTHNDKCKKDANGDYINHDEHNHKKTIAEQMEEYGWKKYTQISTGWVYVYVGKVTDTDKDGNPIPQAIDNEGNPTGRAVTEGKYKLFDEFSIADDANTSTYGAAKITLTAFAIQQAGFATLADAWEAVVETYTYLHTSI